MDTTPNKELAEHSLGCRDSLKNRLFSFPLLTLAHFSYYDIGMNETIDKKKVTEEQIAVWIDEAEKGYDVNVLKKRGRGRPGRGASVSYTHLDVYKRQLSPLATGVRSEASTLLMSRPE